MNQSANVIRMQMRRDDRVQPDHAARGEKLIDRGKRALRPAVNQHGFTGGGLQKCGVALTNVQKGDQ
ncbi:hypothetical protein SDC9_198973 [bioreactor metagenome]|uniref:Uncharacterized protein n=1 Tax=bioreactor metagenome TaxID=1076179 RepID=A0A645IJM2_9ZZZZ